MTDHIGEHFGNYQLVQLLGDHSQTGAGTSVIPCACSKYTSR